MACAAVHEPELLVLDEPFSGLDPQNAEALLTVMTALAAGGTTLVLSSHQMWQLERICNAYCIIAAGEVRASGTLDDLRAAFPTRIVRISPNVPELRQLFSVKEARELPSEDGALVYAMPAQTDFGALLREAVAAAPVTAFERVEPSLTDIYLRAIDGGATTVAA